MDFSNSEKSFSCGKVTSIFSGTPGFLHSSELKRAIRVTGHHLLRSSSARGEEDSDCVSWRSLVPLSVSISSLLRRLVLLFTNCVCFTSALFCDLPLCFLLFRRPSLCIHHPLFVLLFLNTPEHLLLPRVSAAAVGLKAALENQTELPVPVKITVLGTPAEEAVGGKIDLIKEGAFADVDLVFMAHPAQQDASFLPCVALDEVSVKYHGKASHASAYPWEGVNALDAAVLAYNNISVLRQQLKPEWRLHGIIKHGGVKPNIIPAYTELQFYLRTPLVKDLHDLKAKAEACFRAAAVATGCQVEVSYPSHAYYNILPNATLANLYEQNGKALGIEFPEQPDNFSGSTDFGNVSFIVPGIHPFFYICTDAFNHTEEYTDAAGAEKAQLFTLRTAKTLAMTAVDVVCCPDLLRQVREDFSLAKQKQEK